MISAQRADRLAPYASAVPQRARRSSAPELFQLETTTPIRLSHRTAGLFVFSIRSTPDFNYWTILVSHLANGRWSTPEIAPFSGQYADADPFITPDGSHLYSISNRPVTGKTTPDLDIWMVENAAKGWGEPQNSRCASHSPGNEWYPTIAANGNNYFDRIAKAEKDVTTSIVRAWSMASTVLLENLGATIARSSMSMSH